MSKEMYVSVGGIAQKVTKMYVPVNGVAHKVKKAYRGVNGVARQVFEARKKISELAVGDSVFLNVSGTPTEFLVVNRGIPSGSDLYDSSCDGIWLLMKDLITTTLTWDTSNGDYQNSDVHYYLNNTFLGFLDADVQSVIKQIKLPYHKGTGSNGSVASGANGLSTKVFLLSGLEVGFTKTDSAYFPVDGAKLEYFDYRTSRRIAKYDGKDSEWWLRSAYLNESAACYYVIKTGSYSTLNVTSVDAGVGIRPAFILPHNTYLEDGNRLIN